MGILHVLSQAGDTSITWDVADAMCDDLKESAAVREAERIFAQARAQGATAFELSKGIAVRRMDEFDPSAEQIILVPRVMGG